MSSLNIKHRPTCTPFLAFFCNATKAFLRREQIGFGAFPTMYLEIPEATQKTTRHPKNGWTEFRKDRGTNVIYRLTYCQSE
jgi:hypothetical protein